MLNKKIKYLWGISEVGFSVMSMMETTFFLFFLTDVALLPLGIAAMITSIAAIADAVCAVLSGIVIDKTRFKTGKYRPWLLICPPLVVVSFVFCFTKIGSDYTTAAIVIFAYIVSHFIWTVAWNANRGLINVLTEDEQEKSFLSGRIAVGTSAGKIIASLLVPFLSEKIGQIFHGVTVYTIICVITSMSFLVCYYIHYYITRGYDNGMGSSGKIVSFADMVQGIVKNDALPPLLLHDAVRLIAFFGISASCAYYAKLVLGKSEMLSVLLIMIYIGTTVGSSISGSFAKKYGVKNANIIGCACCAVFHFCGYFCGTNVMITSVFLILGQISFGIAYGLTAKMYAMCSSYSEWKTGENTRGVVMSFCSMAIKIAIAIRGVLITAVLGWMNYNPSLSVVSAESRNGIRLLFFGVFSVVMLVSIIPLLFFKLNDERVAKMEKEISHRNKA